MTSVHDTITEALRAHAWSDGFVSNCACEDPAVWTKQDHLEHLATAVLAALDAAGLEVHHHPKVVAAWVTEAIAEMEP